MSTEFFPSYDASIAKDTPGESWATKQAGNAITVDATSASRQPWAIYSNANPLTPWNDFYKAHFFFDTSAIDNGATISAAVFSLYTQAEGQSTFASNTFTVNVYQSTVVSDTVVATTDWMAITSGTPFVTGDLALADMDGTYEDFNFNASGIAAISKTGITKLATQEATYYATNTEPTHGISKGADWNVYFSEETGSTKDPKLTITTSAGPANLKTYNTNPSANIKTINTNPIANVKSLNTNA